ncbi:MAG: hypothetical protein GC164_11845 [Phycisphaera sp.]|nr:hypothetical protein [Phycisphaera sp.]
MPTHAPEITLWTDAPRAGLATQVIELMGHAVRPLAVGGPRSAELSTLAQKLDCPHSDDLRKMLVDHPAAFVLMLTMQNADREDLRMAIGEGAILLTTEPLAGTFDELAVLRGKASAGANAAVTGRIVRVPDFMQAPGYLAAADPKEALGDIQSIGYSGFGQSSDCSLYARLSEAWRIVLHFTQGPTAITATLTGPQASPPEALRNATGHLCALARMPDNCAAVIQVSDRAGRTARGLNITGSAGQLRVHDLGYALYDHGGRLLDERTTDTAKSSSSFADLIAHHWRRLIDQHASTGSLVTQEADDAAALSCCMATLLSARTLQPESPDNLLQMHQAG